MNKGEKIRRCLAKVNSFLKLEETDSNIIRSECVQISSADWYKVCCASSSSSFCPSLPPPVPPSTLLLLFLLLLNRTRNSNIGQFWKFYLHCDSSVKEEDPMWTICHSSLSHPDLVFQPRSCDFPQACWKAQGEGTSKPPIPKFKEQPWDLMLGVVWLFWQRFFCGFKNFLKQEANIWISFEQNSTKSYVAFVYRDRLFF